MCLQVPPTSFPQFPLDAALRASDLPSQEVWLELWEVPPSHVSVHPHSPPHPIPPPPPCVGTTTHTSVERLGASTAAGLPVLMAVHAVGAHRDRARGCLPVPALRGPATDVTLFIPPYVCRC